MRAAPSKHKGRQTHANHGKKLTKAYLVPCVLGVSTQEAQLMQGNLNGKAQLRCSGHVCLGGCQQPLVKQLREECCCRKLLEGKAVLALISLCTWFSGICSLQQPFGPAAVLQKGRGGKKTQGSAMHLIAGSNCTQAVSGDRH